MTNVQLALLKLLYFSHHIQIIPSYIREHNSPLTCSTHRRCFCIFHFHSQQSKVLSPDQWIIYGCIRRYIVESRAFHSPLFTWWKTLKYRI